MPNEQHWKTNRRTESRSKGFDWRCAALVLATSLFAGCGGNPQKIQAEGPEARVDRPRLVPIGEAERASARMVDVFEMPAEGPPPWKLVGGRGVVAGDRDARLHRIQSDGSLPKGAVQVITSKLTSEHFDKVSVTVIVGPSLTLTVGFGLPGEGGPRAASQVLRGRHGDQLTALFDVHQLRWTEGLSRCLTLYDLNGAAFQLISIETLQCPLATFLPQAEEGPELVAIRGEARRVLGLSVGHPLRSVFEAEPNSNLTFSHFVPPVSSGRGREHTLQVTLSDEQEREQRTNVSVEEGWHETSLPLSGMDGRITADFELELERRESDENPAGAHEGHRPDDALIALGEPRIELLGKAAPVVLLITSDTHRADHLGAQGADIEILTPALDQLASNGLLFEDCVASTNVTLPSHVAVMTGVTPRDSGVTQNYDLLSETPTTLAERFREAGWMTLAAVSSSSLSHAHSGLGQGFDRVYSPFQGYRSGADTIASLLPSVDAGEGLPLFIWLHLFDAHTPYEERPDFFDPYYRSDRDPRDPALPKLEPWRSVRGLPEVRDTAYGIALYRSEVTYLDRQLGALLKHHRLRDAIIAFTADHGECLGEHGVWFTHYGLSPQTLHVPLILSWPGGPRGKRIERPVRQWDVGYTLLDLAGLPPGDFPGGSLLESRGSAEPRFSLSVNADSASVFFDNSLLIMHLQEHRHPDPQRALQAMHVVELYHLDSDPLCEHEISAEHPDEGRRLRRLLITWLLDAQSRSWNIDRGSVAVAEIEQLAALGYTQVLGVTDNDWIDPDCDCEHCLQWE